MTPPVAAQTKAAVTASGLQRFTARLLLLRQKVERRISLTPPFGGLLSGHCSVRFPLEALSPPKHQLTRFFLFTLPFFPLLSASGSSLKHVQCPPSDFFGAVNPERDLNSKEQLPRRRTCRLNARFSLAADETDSVCRLLTLPRALFATLRNVCLFANGSVFICLFFQVCTEAGPVIGNHLTL